MSLGELEYEITITFTTGSVAKYKYKRDEENEVEVTRTLITPQGENTVETSIADIRYDSKLLELVAGEFDKLGGVHAPS